MPAREPAESPTSRPPSDGAAANGADKLASLTPREREVLTLFLETFSVKKVAARLGTHPQTVRNQLASVEHKLGTKSQAELVRFAAFARIIRAP